MAMPPYPQLDLTHIFNAVNALSADVHRLSEINRLSTANVQDTLKASVDEATILITAAVQEGQVLQASRAEEMYEDITERLDAETLEERIDDLGRQVEDLPSIDSLSEEGDRIVNRLTNLVKLE